MNRLTFCFHKKPSHCVRPLLKVLLCQLTRTRVLNCSSPDLDVVKSETSDPKQYRRKDKLKFRNKTAGLLTEKESAHMDGLIASVQQSRQKRVWNSDTRCANPGLDESITKSFSKRRSAPRENLGSYGDSNYVAKRSQVRSASVEKEAYQEVRWIDVDNDNYDDSQSQISRLSGSNQGSNTKEKRIVKDFVGDHMSLLCADILADPTIAADWTLIANRFPSGTHLHAHWAPILLTYIAHLKDCVDSKRLYDISMSLSDYIASVSDKHRVSRLISLILMCIRHGGPEKHSLAFAYYDELRRMLSADSRYVIDGVIALDSTSASTLIEAFSRTSRWHECLDFLKMISHTSSPTAANYSTITEAAVHNNDIALMDELLLKMSAEGFIPRDSLFACMIDRGFVEKLLVTLKRFAWLPSAEIAGKLREYFDSRTLADSSTAQRTFVDKSGKCRACGTRLDPPQKVTGEKFNELRVSFLEEALLRRGNLFINTSPSELNVFTETLKRCKPFDVVIDGLNVAYKTRRNATLRHRDFLLAEVIRYLSAKYNRILILGRKHMCKWQSSTLGTSDDAAERCVKWFYMDNVSQDDPFMLYAALHSGENTDIVTSDELRDHRFLLRSKFADRLKIWQRGHQVVFNGRFSDPQNKDQFVLNFKWPDAHETRVQQTADGQWHIPFDDGHPRLSFEMPNAWYCVPGSAI